MKNNDTEEALKFTENSSDEVHMMSLFMTYSSPCLKIVRDEYLRLSITSRNKGFIVKVMDILKNNITETAAGDTVDGAKG